LWVVPYVLDAATVQNVGDYLGVCLDVEIFTLAPNHLDVKILDRSARLAGCRHA
jgi:hypothetical protein